MTYVIIFVILFVLELAYFKIADRYNIIDKPNERSSHQTVTLRGGGIIFYIGAVIWWISSNFSYPYFFIGLSIITVISFIDDIYNLTPKNRLTFQFLSMLLMVVQLLVSTNVIVRDGSLFIILGLVLFALFVCTGAINVFNFMDGINGITGGYSLIVLLSLAYQYHQLHYNDLTSLIVISTLSVIVFCFFNFRNKAKCFAGDVGSVSIAFILVFLLGILIFNSKDISWLTLMAVYGVDGVMTIFHRIMLHENLSQPHRKHAYQLMANELKIPHIIVSSIYMFLQSIVSIIYFIFPGYLSMFACILVLCILYIIFMRKFFYLHHL